MMIAWNYGAIGQLNQGLGVWNWSVQQTAAVVVPGPFYLDAAEVYSAGADKSEVYSAGQQVSSVYAAGAEAAGVST